MDLDPGRGIALRLYESSGRPTRATIRCRWPIVAAGVTNALERIHDRCRVSGATVEIRSSRTRSRPSRRRIGRRRRTDARRDRPCPARRGGPAGLRRLLAAQQGGRADRLPVRHRTDQADDPRRRRSVRAADRVASDGPTAASAGSVELIVPPGWEASPSERIYRLAPGAHLAFDATVRPANGAAPGRYFVAARITDEAGQTHEDVVTVDLRSGEDGTGPHAAPGVRSAALEWAVERALTTAGIGPEPDAPTHTGARHDPGGELGVEVLGTGVTVDAG